MTVLKNYTFSSDCVKLQNCLGPTLPEIRPSAGFRGAEGAPPPLARLSCAPDQEFDEWKGGEDFEAWRLPLTEYVPT